VPNFYEPPTGGVIAEGVGCHVNNAVRLGNCPVGDKRREGWNVKTIFMIGSILHGELSPR